MKQLQALFGLTVYSSLPLFLTSCQQPFAAYRYSYHIWRAWYNGSYTLVAKPIRALELYYPMIQFLIIIVVIVLLQYALAILIFFLCRK